MKNQYLIILVSFILSLLETFIYFGGFGNDYLPSNVSPLNVLTFDFTI